MTEDKKVLIFSLMRKEISHEDFIKKYNLSYGMVNICSDLRDACDCKDAEAVDLFLYLGSVLAYDYKCIDILNDLLIEPWHEKHEEIVRILGLYKSETSATYLYKAAISDFDYLDYDEDYTFADKCIRLLAKINSEGSVSKLKDLSKHPNDYISRSAIKQLDRMKI
ncbi:HEAT repeat domain-containing protein [Tatumella sp. OPLPL6]|uniref:HEAT repeat domain-containing protein n=1 Tax=Tatumella sp. OPLPL6 TaxID=1928657 RepID=UPI000C17F6E2|nr:HEAT repeat domain-containing protein [Tatumella sp. OPLPL6]PIJ45283.1 hypothetical protein BOM24_03725 [Tatumella sp. OPLPL6]